ncbi:MAG: hypothetical protein QNJ44_15480 [Rhodobacter sp.]|nr:hypothetical protein [Rhodobacter sp.]
MNDDQRDGRIKSNTILALFALVLSIVSFFLILLLWNSTPQDVDVDVLAFSITALEVILGVLAVGLAFGAFAGFWMIKTSAVEASREEARRQVDKMVPDLLEQARRLGGSGPESPSLKQSGEPQVNISKSDADDVMRSAKRVGDDDQ